jgi:hypothetical protein
MRPQSARPSGRPPVRPQSARPGSARPQSANFSQTPDKLTRLRRYYFNKLPQDGGGGEGARQFFDVVLEEGDALDSFPSHTTYSYADFLSGGKRESKLYTLVSGESGVSADIEDIEHLLVRSQPRTWRDAYPLYVAARAILKARLAGEMTVQNRALEAKEAERLVAVAKAVDAEQAQGIAETAYKVLHEGVQASYHRLT